MDQTLRPSSLVPEGFLVERTTLEPDRVVIWIRSRQSGGACPACGAVSRRVHSRYLRRAADVPLSGRRVDLRVTVRRFRCDAVLCGRQVFSERFANGVLPPLTLVRQVIRGERTDVFRMRQSSLEPHLPWLDAQWDAGARNATDLWRCLKQQGFRGSLRVIGEWATRRRRAEKADAEALQRIPSARSIARLMTTGRDLLSKSETVMIAAIETGVLPLVEARTLIIKFQSMIRNKAPAGLKNWIERASQSLVVSFARGVTNDEAAVRAAMTLPWSNGQTEGQITKLKLVKRQMYGRGKIDLLQARLIGAI
jgi:transposase